MKKVKKIYYDFYYGADGVKFYRELLGDKYIIVFNEDGKTVSILFYFDCNEELIIDNVYKNGINYKNYRYIKKYAENQTLVNQMKKMK